MTITKLLCQGKKVAFGDRKDFVTKEEWEEIFKDYDQSAKWRIANLAAHNWDVALINGRCLLGAPSDKFSHWMDKDGTETRLEKEELDLYYKEVDDSFRYSSGYVYNWPHKCTRSYYITIEETNE